MERPDPSILRLAQLAADTIRTPLALSYVNDVWELTFEPPLTPAEQSALDALKPTAGTLSLSPAAYEAIRSDIEGLRTYHGLASPTAAQTAQATKAIIRVLRALLRD